MAALRPITTYYDGGRVAHSCTAKAAARAAFRRLIDGDYNLAQVYEGIRCVATIKATGFKVTLSIHIPRGFK